MIKNEENIIKLGSRLKISGFNCTVKYIGPVNAKQGEWFGVEWDVPDRGRNNGLGYFTPCSDLNSCSFLKISLDPNGLLVSAKKPVITGSYFFSTLQEKYIEEAPSSGKVHLGSSNGVMVETVGWEKMQKKLAKLDQLRELGVADRNICSIDPQSTQLLCLPSVQDIDLSKNLLGSLDAVAEICKFLPALAILRLNYNRFSLPFAVSTASKDNFKNVNVITLVGTLLKWSDILAGLEFFPLVQEIYSGSNGIELLSIPGLYDYKNLDALRLVDFENNFIRDWAEIHELARLPALESLNISNNRIASISSTDFKSLVTLNISGNQLTKWVDVDRLNSFPKLTNIRLNRNPITESVALECRLTFLVGRLDKAQRVDGSDISPSKRLDAECYYLSQAHLELNEPGFEQIHPRYAQLCKIHGTPTSKKEEQTLAEVLVKIVLIDRNSQNEVVKQLSKRVTLRMVKTLCARILWPKKWQTAVRGRLSCTKSDGEILDFGNVDDTKTLEYMGITDNDLITIIF